MSSGVLRALKLRVKEQQLMNFVSLRVLMAKVTLQLLRHLRHFCLITDVISKNFNISYIKKRKVKETLGSANMKLLEEPEKTSAKSQNVIKLKEEEKKDEKDPFGEN